MSDVSYTTYEQYLAENETMTYTFKGVSMNPMLVQGRDLFTVRRKGPERCKVNDVVLFKRQDGAYVLHRVIQVNPEDYLIRGDNCVTCEVGIRDEDILGVVTEFTHGEKMISVDNRWYRLYVWVWQVTAGVRIPWKKCVMRAKRIVKKILHWLHLR